MWTVSLFLAEREQPVNLWFLNKLGASGAADKVWTAAVEEGDVVVEDDFDHRAMLSSESIVAVVVASVQTERKMQEDQMVENFRMQQRAQSRATGQSGIVPSGPLPFNIKN